MKFGERVGIAIMSAWGLFAIHQGVNALMKEHKWVALTPSDWGTWVGAIGTVATLIGTIYLARTETRMRERNERTIARLHGASMTPKIENALIGVAEAATMLHLARAGDRDPAYYSKCAAKLDEIEFWSIDDITPLAPLPFNTAIKLAEAVSVVHSVGRTLKLMASKRMLSPVEQRTQVEILSKLIKRAVDHIDEAGRECRLAAVEMQLNLE
ncbi:hypothetical protein [Massilia sp. CT11-137]|uniref:hypothetical protein n=1 Tax=Massilia sp. CT11-137 TaxID=3393901 RepID=UPI0039A4EB8E